MALTEKEVLQVLEMFQQSGWEQMQLQSGSLRLSISKTDRRFSTAPLAAEVGTVPAPSPAPGAARHPLPQGGEGKAGALPTEPEKQPATPAVDPCWHAVKAPLLGHFYASPKPGAAPFVAVGQSVAADDTVAILEVMKLMNHVKAGVAGRVARIAVANGDLVEFDQVLIYIDPAHG